MYCIYTFSIANTKCGQHRRSTKGWMVVQKMKTGWRRACYGLNEKIGGMQHVKGITSKTLSRVVLLLFGQKLTKDCNSLCQRCKCIVFTIWTLLQAELERQLAADDDYDSHAEVCSSRQKTAWLSRIQMGQQFC